LLPLLIVSALLLVGLIWWWVIHPHGRHGHSARDLPLPLFASRTPGRGVRIVGPTLALGAASPAPTASAPARVPTPSTPRVAAERDAPSTAGPAPVEHVVTISPAREQAPSRPERPSTSNGNGNGRSTDEIHAPRTDPVVARAGAGTADPAAERWGPPPGPSPAGTVQFLPGRLEVVQGRGLVGQEVRFVRPERPGERAVVTFGRAEGIPYRHVQLKVPTVSRLHARMSLESGSGSWRLENLSSTNPVSVNGADLPEGAPPVALADGDRVEMGEVVFTFRAR